MKDEKTKEGAVLWRQAREAWVSHEDAETGMPDPMILAAYLDGRLDEGAAAGLEAQMAGDPALLAQLLALLESPATPPDAAGAGVIARAQALREDSLKSVSPAAAGMPVSGFLDRLFGGWLRPAVPAFAVLALVVACAGAFELGRYQSEQILPQQASGVGDADIPDPLSLDIFI